jgi:hypothetical protein
MEVAMRSVLAVCACFVLAGCMSVRVFRTPQYVDEDPVEFSSILWFHEPPTAKPFVAVAVIEVKSRSMWKDHTDVNKHFEEQAELCACDAIIVTPADEMWSTVNNPGYKGTCIRWQ